MEDRLLRWTPFIQVNVLFVFWQVQLFVKWLLTIFTIFRHIVLYLLIQVQLFLTVVAYYLLFHEFSHIVFIFCFTNFLTSCLFMRLELLPCRTPLFYCLNASVVWRRWFGTRTFSKSFRTHWSKLIHSFHLPQFFLFPNSLGLVLRLGLLLKVRMSFPKKYVTSFGILDCSFSLSTLPV